MTTYRIETVFDWQEQWQLYMETEDSSVAVRTAFKNSRVDKAARILVVSENSATYASSYRTADEENGDSFVHFYGMWDDEERFYIWKFVREHDKTAPLDRYNKWHLTRMGDGAIDIRRDSYIGAIGPTQYSYNGLLEYMNAYYTR